MKVNNLRRYELSDDFFSLDGSVVMKLSADAAADVCKRSIENGVFVARIEGGWHSPGFEARLDCIWDAMEAPIDTCMAEKINLAAIEFIRSERVA